jgi:hypothetical protein
VDQRDGHGGLQHEGRKMIGYKVFDSEHSLVEWQKRELPKIYQITPLVLNFGGTAENTRIDMTTGVGCFVIYEMKEAKDE